MQIRNSLKTRQNNKGGFAGMMQEYLMAAGDKKTQERLTLGPVESDSRVLSRLLGG